MHAAAPTTDQLRFCLTLRAGVHEILGPTLHSYYLYGAMVFPRPEHWRVDVDFHVVLAAPVDDGEIRRLRALHDDLAERGGLGRELDGCYLDLAAAHDTALPRNVAWPEHVDTAWALHRAHVHAGRYRVLHGADPRGFVPPATWAECVEGLDAERRFVEAHPEHPQFGLLNLSRLLRTWQTHDVVLSKYAALRWALQALDPAWRPALEAAARDYTGEAQPGDAEVMRETLPAYREYCLSEIERYRHGAGHQVR